ncbi:hypothetical protein VNO77_27207 [Canavalia gladiata]|uniref:Uncharacterized protein n=1 Tax=Canavalia gladiata TaxID=3824 RepID=A0AAN9Q693_CANGL
MTPFGPSALHLALWWCNGENHLSRSGRVDSKPVTSLFGGCRRTTTQFNIMRCSLRFKMPGRYSRYQAIFLSEKLFVTITGSKTQRTSRRSKSCVENLGSFSPLPFSRRQEEKKDSSRGEEKQIDERRSDSQAAGPQKRKSPQFLRLLEERFMVFAYPPKKQDLL